VQWAGDSVTENLHSFLSYFSRTNMRGEDLWVDAICINQSDENERSSQVNLMSTIYRAARRVLVWLGKEDQFTTDACLLLHTLGGLSLGDRRTIGSQNLESEKCQNLLGPYNQERYWQALP